MTFVALGDLAQTFLLSRYTADTKTRLADLTHELASGTHSDLGRKLAGDFGPLADIDAQLDRLTAYQTAAAEASLRADSLQLGLETISETGQGLVKGLLIASDTAQPAVLSSASQDAAHKLAQVVSVLNTEVGGLNIFSGAATDTPAMVAADQILASLEAAVTGLTTSQDVLNTIDAWFDTPGGGFETMAYQGSTQPSGPVRVDDGQLISFDVRADDPALRASMKSLATAALLGSGTVLSGDTAAQAELMESAAEGLLAAEGNLAALSATVGSVQNRLALSETANAAEQTLLQMARNDIVGADPYETATRLEAAQTQLETLYTITARLSRLSLVDYLR